MEIISTQFNNNNLIQTMAEILEMLMIQCTRNSNWFNKLIINLFTYRRSIIEVLFSHDFGQYLTEIENKMKELLIRSKQKLKRFFEKTYRIREAAPILGLSRLINNHPSLDLTWISFCKNSWFENSEKFYLLNLWLLIRSFPKYIIIKGII